MIRLKGYAAAALIGLLSACVAAGSSKEEAGTMSATITAAENGKTITLHVGDTAVLSLPENASTGYRWTLHAFDHDLVEIEDRPFVPSSKAVGSGGQAQWSIRAKSSGVAQIKLKRWRAWEGDLSTNERYEVTLQVEP